MAAAAPKGAPAESYRMRRKRADGPIKFRTNFRNVVYSVLKSRPGWVETDRWAGHTLPVARHQGRRAAAWPHDTDAARRLHPLLCSETDWDFQWAERDWVYESFDTMHLEPWQRMNHFRNGREVSAGEGGREGARSSASCRLWLGCPPA